jgi:hypothetical protein
MIALVLATFMLAVQGVPVLPNQGGTVTGSLRTAAGAPAAGVRVSALAKPETPTELTEAFSLAGIAETDTSGRFRIENIPPGRYYIVAGRLDVPTYYPGAVNATGGTAILVTPGLTVPGIDFVLNNVSVGRAPNFLNPVVSNPSWVIPIRALVESGGKIPLFGDGVFPVLRLSRTDRAPVEVPLTSLNVTVPEMEYRATIENLPAGYAVKSFTFGSSDLQTKILQLSTVVSVNPLNTASTIGVPRDISIVLQRVPIPRSPGVQISGRIQGDPNRSIYISGVPGSIYADGAFEFRGVPAGRHTIVTLDNPGRDRALAASIVVGDRDLSNVELEQTSIPPLVTGNSRGPAPAGDLASGTRIPLASVRGRVVDGMTGRPMDAGRVVVNSDYSLTFPLEEDGRFEIPRLLPGQYALNITAFGIGTVTRTVELDDKDVELDLAISEP